MLDRHDGAFRGELLQLRRKQVGAHGVWDTIIAGWMDDRHVGKSPGMSGQRSSWMPTLSLPLHHFFSLQTHRPTDSQPTVVGPLRCTVQGNVVLKQKFSWLEECFDGCCSCGCLEIEGRRRRERAQTSRFGAIEGPITNDVSTQGETVTQILTKGREFA